MSLCEISVQTTCTWKHVNFCKTALSLHNLSHTGNWFPYFLNTWFVFNKHIIYVLTLEFIFNNIAMNSHKVEHSHFVFQYSSLCIQNRRGKKVCTCNRMLRIVHSVLDLLHHMIYGNILSRTTVQWRNIGRGWTVHLYCLLCCRISSNLFLLLLLVYHTARLISALNMSRCGYSLTRMKNVGTNFVQSLEN